MSDKTEILQDDSFIQPEEYMTLPENNQETEKRIESGQKPEVELEPKIDPQDPTKSQGVQEDKFAAKFAALSRKEKAIRDQEAQLKARLKELEDRQKGIEERGSKYDSLSERLKSEPLKVMEENGLTYEQLTEMVLNNEGKPTNDIQLQLLREQTNKNIDEIRKQNEELRNQLLEKSKQEEEAKYNQVIEDFTLDIEDFVQENSEDYSVIRATENGADLVFNVIEEHYNETGRILDIKDAADNVEKYLLEQAMKYKDVKKMRELFLAEQEAKEPEMQSSPTLTNTQTSQVSTNKGRKLSDEESLREAAKLIKWDD